ncbi:MAG: nitroreductase family protein [bacterium]|nr:nitroreductase family protein [bacterium]
MGFYPETLDELMSSRRSIRQYKNKPVPGELVLELLEAARMSPSASNSQPWLFKVITDDYIKNCVAKSLYNQLFAATAPIQIICCADVRNYLDDGIAGARELERSGAADSQVVEVVIARNKQQRDLAESDNSLYENYSLRIAVNVAVAVNNIQLAAHNRGLGSCWPNALGDKQISQIFGWNRDIYPVAVLAIGYPAENPEPRSRKSIEEIVI